MLTLVHAFVVIVLIAAGCAAAPPPDFGNGPPTAAAEKDGIALGPDDITFLDEPGTNRFLAFPII